MVFLPLDSAWLRDVQLSVLYRRNDQSPILQALPDIMRKSLLAADGTG